MKIGVIDIGYNAIRAAVYESDKIGAREIFNNKFKNDILALLSGQTLDVKHQTYLCFKHILNVFNNLKSVKDSNSTSTNALVANIFNSLVIFPLFSCLDRFSSCWRISSNTLL